MTFVVSGLIRPANDIVKSGNMFNSEPGEGQEYILVTLNVSCNLSTDKQCDISKFNLKVLGSDGVLKDSEFMIAGVEGILEDSTFYGGASINGNVPFIINQGDNNIILVYEPFFGDSFYLSLP